MCDSFKFNEYLFFTIALKNSSLENFLTALPNKKTPT